MVTCDAGFPQIEFDEVEASAAAMSPASVYGERIRALRAESVEVRADLDALDESIAWLRAELRTLRSLPVTPAPQPAPAAFFAGLLDWRIASTFVGCLVVGLRVFL